MHELTKLMLDNEMDIILVHKRSMKLAELAGLSLASQTTFATAVSEVARLAVTSSSHASLTLGVSANDTKGWRMLALLQDRRQYISGTFEAALTHARRLVDELSIDVTDKGTDIRLYCTVADLKSVSSDRINGWKDQFIREPSASPYDDIKRKNSQLQELAERLSQSEQQYKQVTNSLPLLIFSMTSDGKLIYTNQGFTTFLGKTIPDLNEEGWLRHFHEDDYPVVKMIWADSVASSLPFKGEWRLRNSLTGEYIWHMVSATPLRNADQQVVHWTGFLADVHAQKVIEQTLRDNEELRQNKSRLESSQQQLTDDIDELSRSNTELAQFAYVASHDLQEPLRKIQAFSSMLTEQYGPALDTNAQDIIRRMQSATSRMQELIRGLLTYSRLNTERPSFHKVSLSALVAEVQSDLETAIRGRSAQIQVGPLPVIQGNTLQLRQLFQNLLSNALKFTPSERVPVVCVDTRTVSAEQLPVSPLSPGNNYLEISIADNGIGFDEKYIDRIFNLFQRLHGRSEYAGTGIGLAICKKVADNHGGYLTARSQPGHGATFLVYLPVN
ncbi:sensor histidine kinase [Spirosoma flavum]|uniref:histidine kinase n=1 Tax=Spirosoma flavum TaxID=2048557 RepID=A0ABW6AEF3_9BACT